MYPILLLSLAATTGATWVEDTFFTGQQPTWKKFAMTADGSVIAGAGHNSYWVSTDSGATWTRRSPVEKKYEGIALSADGSKLVAGGIEVNMWKSDGGPTFQSGLADAQFPSSTSQKLRDLAMSPDGNIIVSAGDTSDVDAQTWTQGSFRTTDFGATWNQISTTPMTGIAMSDDGNVIAAVTSQSNAGVRVSTDGGANWATNTPSESTSLHAIAMSSDGSIMAAVGHGNGGIWLSTNTGSTWTQVVSDSGVWESVSMSADGSVMGATKMSSKLWTSSDSGATWAEDATSPDNAKFIAISSDGTKMVMEGAGKLQYKGFPTTTTTTTTTTTSTTTSGAGSGGTSTTQATTAGDATTSASHHAAFIGVSCMASLAMLA